MKYVVLVQLSTNNLDVVIGGKRSVHRDLSRGMGTGWRPVSAGFFSVDRGDLKVHNEHSESLRLKPNKSRDENMLYDRIFCDTTSTYIMTPGEDNSVKGK